VLQAAPASLPVWQKLENSGVSYRLYKQPEFVAHVFDVDLKLHQIRILNAGENLQTHAYVRQMVALWPWVIASNASFFDESQRVMGLVVNAGQVISKHLIKSWGILSVRLGHAEILSGQEFDWKSHASQADAVVQGLPRLVVHKKIPALKAQSATRTIVCVNSSDKDNHHLFLIATSRVDTSLVAHFLVDELGCEEALNLDGGPSTQLEARAGSFSLSMAGGWGVPNALVILPVGVSP